MSKIRIRQLLAMAVCGAALGGAALGPAPQAHASPLSFVQALNDHGIVVYDTVSALSTGHAICDALKTNNGADVARAIYATTTYTDVPSMEVAATWVVVSVEQLCPWQDHRSNASGQAVLR